METGVYNNPLRLRELTAESIDLKALTVNLRSRRANVYEGPGVAVFDHQAIQTIQNDCDTCK